MGSIGSHNTALAATAVTGVRTTHIILAILITAAAAATQTGCAPDRGPDTASRRARVFYEALNAGDSDAAENMLTGQEPIARLLSRYGTLRAWGDRVTKNGIVSQLHAVERSQDADHARVELIVMFHDGTRRRDDLTLSRIADIWHIDAASVPGNEPYNAP